MTIIKQFAQDEIGALDDRMDQLVEVLAQLLEEKQDSAVPDEANPRVTEAIADLHSGFDRVIHVVGAKPKKSCPRSL